MINNFEQVDNPPRGKCNINPVNVTSFTKLLPHHIQRLNTVNVKRLYYNCN